MTNPQEQSAGEQGEEQREWRVIDGVTLSAPAARVVADPATVLRMGRVVVTVA